MSKAGKQPTSPPPGKAVNSLEVHVPSQTPDHTPIPSNDKPPLQETDGDGAQLTIGPLLTIGDRQARARCLEILRALAEHLGVHRLAFAQTGADWMELGGIRHRYPEFNETYTLLRDWAAEWRLRAADDSTYERAVVGWLEPVYRNESDGDGGSHPVVAGYVRRYSDKALELYLRAYHARYKERGDGADQAKGFQYVIVMPPPAPAAGRILPDPGPVTVEMASKAHPDGGEIAEKAAKQGVSGRGSVDCVSTDPPRPACIPGTVQSESSGDGESE